jgi:hypothetical protein
VVLGSILSPTLLKKLLQLSSCLQGSQSVKGSEELDNTHEQNHWFFAKNLQQLNTKAALQNQTNRTRDRCWVGETEGPKCELDTKQVYLEFLVFSNQLFFPLLSCIQSQQEKHISLTNLAQKNTNAQLFN